MMDRLCTNELQSLHTREPNRDNTKLYFTFIFTNQDLQKNHVRLTMQIAVLGLTAVKYKKRLIYLLHQRIPKSELVPLIRRTLCVRSVSQDVMSV